MLVRDALQRAAARGVAVYVVVDWLGTGRATCNLLRQQLGAAGVQFRSFNPWFRRGIARTHRKICVTDRDYAFVGGLNINDDLVSDRRPEVVLPAPRWDFAIRIRGTLVATIYLEMTAQWTRLGNMKLLARWENFRRSRALLPAGGGGPAQAGLVLRDNLRDRRTIQRAYLQALGRARKSALLANPYFAPGRKLRRALESARAARGRSHAAARGRPVPPAGCDRAFVLPETAGSPACASSSTARPICTRKSRWWTTSGPRSAPATTTASRLFVNHEANVVVQDHAFAEDLRRRIESAVAEAVPVRRADFSHIGWLRRLRNGTIFLLYRAAIRLVSWGRYD